MTNITPSSPLCQLYTYNAELCDDYQSEDATNLLEKIPAGRISWLNLNQLDVDQVTKLTSHLGVHELTIEDILNPSQRPKIDDYQTYAFITVKMPHPLGQSNQSMDYEQISFLVFPDKLISFQEMAGDVFDPIRKRLSNKNGALRTQGVDYLLYALLDGLIDSYMTLEETLSERIDVLESSLMEQNRELSLTDLYQVKRDMIGLRKALLPLRSITNYFTQGNLDWLPNKSYLFFKDCADHVTRTIENLDLQRDVVSSILDIHLSAQNNRMNEVMKVLAIFGTIFIPLTFISGVYGMNFENMPGLQWQYGYYVTISVMAAISIGLLAYFKKKHWF